ncbi:Uma2 family endonuclease [Megamonas hypermegale]|uniref:Uma2 family endonuclease n=1 Tax=Megamonas hypermegale TaxID=158847 RepID=UPI0026EB05DD|nr:Uma2 family endonuclease [Megamonas hypermegale]
MDNLAYIDDSSLKEKTEMIDGRIYMMSPRPRVTHALACTNIVREFGLHLRGKICTAFCDGVDVFLDEKNRFVPDVMIVCNPDIIKEDGIHGAPDLVVEVLSVTTAKNDKGRKKDIYAKAGVKEYWLVDTWNKSVEVYYNKNGWLVLDNIYFYLTEEERKENDQLPDNDKDKIEVFDTIELSVCDNFAVELEYIFEKI